MDGFTRDEYSGGRIHPPVDEQESHESPFELSIKVKQLFPPNIEMRRKYEQNIVQRML